MEIPTENEKWHSLTHIQKFSHTITLSFTQTNWIENRGILGMRNIQHPLTQAYPSSPHLIYHTMSCHTKKSERECKKIENEKLPPSTHIHTRLRVQLHTLNDAQSHAEASKLDPAVHFYKIWVKEQVKMELARVARYLSIKWVADTGGNCPWAKVHSVPPVSSCGGFDVSTVWLAVHPSTQARDQSWGLWKEFIKKIFESWRSLNNTTQT